MKNKTLGDFFPPNDYKMVEDDKTKIRRLEREISHLRNGQNLLNQRCEELRSENFALKVQLNEFQHVQKDSPRSLFPSFAQISKPSSFVPKTSKQLPLKEKSDQSFLPQVGDNTPVQTSTKKISDNSSEPLLAKPSKNNSPPTSVFFSMPKKNLQSPFKTNQAKNNSFSSTSSNNARNDTPFVSSFSKPTKTFPSKQKVHIKKQKNLTSQKVFIYHDSNVAWSLPSTIEKAVEQINTYRPHPIKTVNVSKIYTPRLENTLNAIQSTDHSNSVVIISVMTNNAKAFQSVSRSKSILNDIINNLKKEISVENIIVLESPPSLNFNIFPYNKAVFDLCQSEGVFFARNLVKRTHLKPDGLHILNHYKHLVIKSIAAAIKKVDPKSHYHFPKNWYTS